MYNTMNITDSIIDHTDSIIDHTDSIIDHTDSIIDHTDSIIDHTDSIIDHTDSLPQVQAVDDEVVTIINSFLHLCPSHSHTLSLNSPSDQPDCPSPFLRSHRDSDQSTSELPPLPSSLYSRSQATAMALSAFPECEHSSSSSSSSSSSCY